MDLRLSDLETDAEPTPMARMEYKRKLVMIDEHLTSRNLKSVKFLCQDFIPAVILEQSMRGIDIFQHLENRNKIGPNSMDLILEVLLRIGRNDIIRKLGSSAKEVSSKNIDRLPSFRKLLYDICEDIDSRSLSEMKFIVAEGLSQSQLDKVKTAEDLFVAMEQADILSADNTSQLENLLSDINRPDLVEKVKSLAGVCMSRPSTFEPLNTSTHSNDSSKQTTEMKVPPINDMEEWNRRVQNLYVEQSAEKKRRDIEDGEPSDYHQTIHSYQSDPDQSLVDHQKGFESQMTGLDKEVAGAIQDLEDHKHDGQRQNIRLYGVQARDLTNGSPTTFHSLPNLPNDLTIDQSAQGSIGSTDQYNPVPQRYQPLPHQPSYRDFSLCYEMNSRPRGICLILNNKKFQQAKDDTSSRRLPERIGSEIDIANLEYIWGKLNFTVRMEKDQTKEEMIGLMHRLALNEDHSRYDCFVCCVLSHGSVGSVYSADGKEVAIKELTQPFKSVLCTGLRGKPKLFFIQACQGKEKQPGAPDQSDFETDAPPLDSTSIVESEPCIIPAETIPNEADFLIGYATVPGYVSFRSRSQGSWYITKLTEMLDKYAHKHDLLSILIMVNNEVSKGIAPMPEANYKQSPAPLVTLRKKIFFC